jgi:deoxyribose-phosphate aldolase
MEKIPLNKYIDHTILKPETTNVQVIQVCNEAKQFDFASVCINSCFTKLVAEQLRGSDVKCCSAIGFPLGANSTEVKVFEAGDAIKNGAQEIDMVINVGAIKSGDFTYVEKEIKAVVKVAKDKALVKIILETCLLTNEEIVKVCQIAKNVGANFVKTSTGFNSAGATVEHIALMRKTVGPSMGVKASGGIRTLQSALDMIKAGATRIGSSAGVTIINEYNAKK